MNGTQNNAPHDGGQVHIEQCYALGFSLFIKLIRYEKNKIRTNKTRISSDYKND